MLFSGGIDRSWKGHPRRYYYELTAGVEATVSPSADKWSCVCRQSTEVDMPQNLREFQECDLRSHSCKDIET